MIHPPVEYMKKRVNMRLFPSRCPTLVLERMNFCFCLIGKWTNGRHFCEANIE